MKAASALRAAPEMAIVVVAFTAVLVSSCGFFSSEDTTPPNDWQTITAGEITIQVPPDLELLTETELAEAAPNWPFSGEVQAWRGENFTVWVHWGEGAASPAGRSQNVEIVQTDIGGRSATVRHLSGDGDGSNAPPGKLGDDFWSVATFGRTPEVVVWVSYSNPAEKETALTVLDSIRF